MTMKAISILCAVSYAILLITMCDMGVWFWIASTAFAVTSLVISNELDNIENQKNKAMTTVEELQSMTHEDLVRRVQELEQDLKEVKEQSDMWLDSFTRLQARHESSINALDNIVKLAKIEVNMVK
mgnify:FL=1